LRSLWHRAWSTDYRRLRQSRGNHLRRVQARYQLNEKEFNLEPEAMRLPDACERLGKPSGQGQELQPAPGTYLVLQPFHCLDPKLVFEHAGNPKSRQEQPARVLEELLHQQAHIHAKRYGRVQEL
jgi:hypothetical protein